MVLVITTQMLGQIFLLAASLRNYRCTEKLETKAGGQLFFYKIFSINEVLGTMGFGW
jgi:hypothetical protein